MLLPGVTEDQIGNHLRESMQGLYKFLLIQETRSTGELYWKDRMSEGGGERIALEFSPS